MSNFASEIEKGNLADMSLIIYYLNPSLLTFIPLSVDDLVANWHEHKIIVDGIHLERHLELLKRLSCETLIYVDEKNPYMNVRVYYMFTDKRGRIIFDVAMWGFNQSVYVNGYEVEVTKIFGEVLLPFLPGDQAVELDLYLTYMVGS